MSATTELAQKLEKRNKINEGELQPENPSQPQPAKPETCAEQTSNELAQKLGKRHQINEGVLEPTMNTQGISIYSENPNMSRKTIQHLEAKFKEIADKEKRTALNLSGLKALFESLGCAQTHLTLKKILREADKDPESGELTFRDFLAVFRKACSDEIDEESPLRQLAALNEIDVASQGVSGAKDFFTAKMKMASDEGSFAKEVAQEKAEAAQKEEEARENKQNFQEMRSKFSTAA